MAEYQKRRKKVCLMCTGKTFTYKDVEMMRKFINDKGKIVPRRVTGSCSRHQRYIAGEIKKARFMALIPYVN